jgi:hypothetical protein
LRADTNFATGPSGGKGKVAALIAGDGTGALDCPLHEIRSRLNDRLSMTMSFVCGPNTPAIAAATEQPPRKNVS